MGDGCICCGFKSKEWLVFLMMYVSAMVENKIKAKFNEIIYSAK
jgi:hypothetical protein